MNPSAQTVMTWAEPLRLAESRLRAVETTLANIGAPTHDAEGARLNANGRLVDWLAGRRSEGWIGPDPMREKDAEIERLREIERAARIYFKEFDHLIGRGPRHDYPERRDLRDALKVVPENDGKAA